jgi:hypothetical protein
MILTERHGHTHRGAAMILTERHGHTPIEARP